MAIVRRYRSIPVDPPNSLFKDGDIEWVPTLQVRLWKKHSKPSQRIVAITDTGSPYCLFDAAWGRAIGLKVDSGEKQEITGVVAGAKLDCYFHRISISVEDIWTLDIIAGFMDNFTVGALLGRRGFFDNFKVLFSHSQHPPTLEIDRVDRPN